MSETATFEPSTEPETEKQFGYRPVPMIVPMALFLGLTSGIGLVSVAGLVLGLVGIILGLIAWRIVAKADGAYGGRVLAICAVSLSTFFLVTGTCVHAYQYTHEVPDGFERVSFSRDIARKKFIEKNQFKEIHPEVKEIAGKQIFLKGYMYPTRKTTGLTTFIIVKDNGDCCFGGQPAMSDMILVKMDPGLKVDFRPTLVAVAGEFVLRDVNKARGLNPAYELRASYFSKAKTTY